MENQINTFIHLSKTHRELQRERNTYIYQIVISVLSLEALFIGSLLSRTYDLNSLFIKIGISIFLVLLASATSWHLFLLHRANHMNKELAEQSEEMCQKILNGLQEDFKLNTRRSTYRGCHMWIWQSCFLLIGTLASVLLVFLA